jgi:hypothetical protein
LYHRAKNEFITRAKVRTVNQQQAAPESAKFATPSLLTPKGCNPAAASQHKKPAVFSNMNRVVEESSRYRGKRGVSIGGSLPSSPKIGDKCICSVNQQQHHIRIAS